jgi:soluble lytic murein transglycosylase-like protein
MTHHRASAPLDAIVEMMEYDETRDYVKKVSGNYARYARLYEPTTPPVAVPRAVTGDDPAVIDF